MKFRLLLSVCFLLVFFKARAEGHDSLFALYTSKAFVFDSTHSYKARVTITEEDSEIKITAKIRMYKDSLIWVSLGSGGIEGVRALMTKDSVLIKMPLNNQKINTDYSFFKDRFMVETSLYQLQSLLSGGVYFSGDEKKQVDETDSTVSFFTDGADLQLIYRFHKQNYTLQQSMLIDKRSSQSLLFTFEDYSADEKPVSLHRILKLEGYGKPKVLDMQLEKTESGISLSFPF